MRTPAGPIVATFLLAAGLLAATARPTGAQDAGATALDSGRFVVFVRGEAVATEDFDFQQRHDSLFVTSQVTRRGRTSDGRLEPFKKSMELILRSGDSEMLLYRSHEAFDGHERSLSVTAAATTIVVASERDGLGQEHAVVRPPGRFYVLDPGQFVLFDVIARNLHGRIFGDRPVGLVTLGTPPSSVVATASPVGPDTLRWGGTRVVGEALRLSDSTSTFMLHLAPSGRLLRLDNAAAQVVVEREAPPVPPASRARKPKAR